MNLKERLNRKISKEDIEVVLAGWILGMATISIIDLISKESIGFISCLALTLFGLGLGMFLGIKYEENNK